MMINSAPTGLSVAFEFHAYTSGTGNWRIVLALKTGLVLEHRYNVQYLRTPELQLHSRLCNEVVRR